MRNLFVKGLMATAAVVALASCSNDEEVAMTQSGETHDVTLGVSVQIPGTKAATGAGDVNQVTDGTFAAIDGIYVVPMVNGTRRGPIELDGIAAGTGTGSSKTTWKTERITNDVNGFRVYGNLPSDVAGRLTSGSFSYAAPATTDNAHSELVDWMESNMDGKSLVGQYPLLYFANSDVLGGYYGVKDDVNDWDDIVDWKDLTKEALGDRNRVKISPVNYGVGVLASGVSYRRATRALEAEANCFGADDNTPAEDRQTYTQLSSTGMTLCGVFIQDQPTAIDIDLLGTDHDGVLVAAATNATLQTSALSFATGGNAVVENANIYAIVTPEENEGIPVSFQFKNETGNYLFLNSGDVIAPDGYVYYSTSLSKNGTSLKVFDADYTTLLNANIINWSNGTPYLPVATDVQIGVEIDVQWQQGISYDVEI